MREGPDDLRRGVPVGEVVIGDATGPGGEIVRIGPSTPGPGWVLPPTVVDGQGCFGPGQLDPHRKQPTASRREKGQKGRKRGGA